MKKELRNPESSTIQPSSVMATDALSLKLLVNPKSHKVLFAEGGRDFVDFLFSVLSLSVGTVTRLLTEEAMEGCLGNLYDSMETLADNYKQPTANKDTLLKPGLSSSASNVPLSLPNFPSSRTGKIFSWVEGKLYSCNAHYSPNCRTYATNDPKSPCPACNNAMNQTITLVNPVGKASSSNGRVYVKGVTYMIMNDLVVKPMSTISSIALLNKFNVKEVGVLEEKAVDMGMDLGVKLLKASMQSKTVLTNVFLGMCQSDAGTS